MGQVAHIGATWLHLFAIVTEEADVLIRYTVSFPRYIIYPEALGQCV